ncbi:MAG: HNH endonuclease, partial [Acidimicrobiia bacterium]|nr:HNH endonuclease [Acidimicrobiia bacterium]
VKANQRTIRLLEGVGSVAAARLSELGGLSAEDVFSTVGRQSTAEARRVQQRAGLADVLAGLTKAFMAGSVPTANLDTVATARHRLRHNQSWQTAFDDMDTSITRKAGRMNPTRFSGWIRDLVDRISDDGHTEQRSQEQRNSLRTWTSAAGRWQARLDLDPIAGEKLQGAIDAEARSLAKQASEAGEPAHHGERLNAQALASLVDSANGVKGRPSINVICDLDTLHGGVWDGTVKRTGAGNNLPLSSLRQLLCDAWITHTVLGPSGRALAVGRSYRTATDAQRAALRVMYQTCALCDVKFDHCELHHIHQWENGGPTDLTNLIPLCGVHHERVHHTQWRIELDDQRTLTVTKPDGHTWKQIPLPSAGPTRARNAQRKNHTNEQHHHRHRTRSTIE